MTAGNRKGQKNDDDFDIKKIISKFLDHWKLYIISIVSLLILGLLFIRYSTPLYRAHAKVLVQDDKGSSASSFLASSALQDFNALMDVQSNVNNELAILKTRDLIEKVVREMKLNISYLREGRVRSVELYNKSPFIVSFIPKSDSITPAVFNISFKDSDQNKFKIDGAGLSSAITAGFGDTINTRIGKLCVFKTGTPFEDEGYLLSVNSIDQAVAAISNNLIVEITSTQTTVIDLTYNSNVPKKAEDVLQKLISGYVHRNLSEKNQISDSTLGFINQRIAIVSAELNTIETNIQNFKQKNRITDISEQAKLLIDNSSDYYKKLNEVEVQLNVIKSMLSLVQDNNSNRQIPSMLNTDPTFLNLVEKYNSLAVERDKLLLSTTEENPYVQNLDSRISNLKSDIVKSLQNQQSAYEISRDRIIAENSLLNAGVLNVPLQERTYIGLSRDQNVKQALYLYLLQKKEETAITKASNISSASVIEVPKSEFLPYFPINSLVIAVSLVLGLIIPTAFIILKFMLSSRIISREDITNNTDCTILAEIGHSDKAGPLLTEEKGRSVLAEQFRIFRTNMDFLISKHKCPKILITSSMTGEGKSFIAANLAQVYAYSGKKVLLIEMDLRKPKLSSMLEMPNTTGFTNFIISGKPVHEFIKPIPASPNIYLMSSGPLPPNPAELLMSATLGDMFDELSKRFDTIIIDSPPIGAVTDAQILSKHSHTNLYIVRQRYSYKNSTEIINDLIENNKFPNLYLVINDVKQGTSYRYGYGYGYTYGYGYGYGADKENHKSSFKKWLTPNKH